MKQITLNSKHWWARYYKFAYGSLPSTLCAYRGASIFLGLMTPLMLPGFITNRILNWLLDGWQEEGKGEMGISILLTIMGTGMLAPLLVKLGMLQGWALILGYLGGSTALILGIALILGVIFGAMWLVIAGWKTLTKPKGNQPGVINMMYTSLKEKHCSKIKWQ